MACKCNLHSVCLKIDDYSKNLDLPKKVLNEIDFIYYYKNIDIWRKIKHLCKNY